MREILYIQAGNYANHVGTHFWNAQETYFTYDNAAGGAGEEPLMAHDVSFREGLNSEGEQTYRPRVLMFDHKENFGSLGAYSQMDVDPEEEDPSLWTGRVVRQEHDRVPPHEYQSTLDHEFEEPAKTKLDQPAQEQAQEVLATRPPRYWSDFNRVFYAPKSLHQIPGALTRMWTDSPDDVWGNGVKAFGRYDQDTGLMENSVRSFMEECDGLRGLQVMNDTSFFGSFTYQFLEHFHDEHEKKLSSMVFSFASTSLQAGKNVQNFDFTDTAKVKAVLNDALCVQRYNEEASMYCLVQSPESWGSGEWQDGLNFDLKNQYQTSAIVASHLDSATVPLRQLRSYADMPAFVSYLTMRGTLRLTHLNGSIPAEASSLSEAKRQIYDFSSIVDSEQSSMPYSRWSVFRGLGANQVPAYEEWATSGLRDPPITRFSPYQMPSSFPTSIFKTTTTAKPGILTVPDRKSVV